MYSQRQTDDQHTELVISSKKTQQWMSVLKMLLIVLVCIGQVYFITLFFQIGEKKRGAGGRQTFGAKSFV